MVWAFRIGTSAKSLASKQAAWLPSANVLVHGLPALTIGLMDHAHASRSRHVALDLDPACLFAIRLNSGNHFPQRRLWRCRRSFCSGRSSLITPNSMARCSTAWHPNPNAAAWDRHTPPLRERSPESSAAPLPPKSIASNLKPGPSKETSRVGKPCRSALQSRQRFTRCPIRDGFPENRRSIRAGNHSPPNRKPPLPKSTISSIKRSLGPRAQRRRVNLMLPRKTRRRPPVPLNPLASSPKLAR